MSDCIEREDAIRICERLSIKCENNDMAFALRWAVKSISYIPAADVAPVRHGRWINIHGDEESLRQCSECFQEFDYVDGICYLVSGQRLPKYCPACGAKMDEEGE